MILQALEGKCDQVRCNSNFPQIIPIANAIMIFLALFWRCNILRKPVKGGMNDRHNFYTHTGKSDSFSNENVSSATLICCSSMIGSCLWHKSISPASNVYSSTTCTKLTVSPVLYIHLSDKVWNGPEFPTPEWTRN